MGCEAGLKPYEIDAMDMVDVLFSIEGHNKREQGEWERARIIGFTIHQHSMAKHKSKKPEKWLPFPWDVRSTTPQKTEAEAREFYEKRKAEINKIKQLQNGG